MKHDISLEIFFRVRLAFRTSRMYQKVIWMEQKKKYSRDIDWPTYIWIYEKKNWFHTQLVVDKLSALSRIDVHDVFIRVVIF